MSRVREYRGMVKVTGRGCYKEHQGRCGHGGGVTDAVQGTAPRSLRP
jgi:hypothetical protein